MKNLLISLCLFISSHTFACQLSIPESYVPTFLNPPVSGHYEKCESEPCHCVDKINPYFSELVDDYVLDYVSQKQYESCTDELDCDAKFSYLKCTEGEEIKNYEALSVYCAVNVMRVEGKKLVESPSKKAAYEAKILAEKQVLESKVASKEQLKSDLKAIDWNPAMTAAQLKLILKKKIQLDLE